MGWSTCCRQEPTAATVWSWRHFKDRRSSHHSLTFPETSQKHLHRKTSHREIYTSSYAELSWRSSSPIPDEIAR